MKVTIIQHEYDGWWYFEIHSYAGVELAEGIALTKWGAMSKARRTARRLRKAAIVQFPRVFQYEIK